eukprot:scaffold3515_cov126-Cylindrotheca_fusiformis.AAC.44
MSLWKETYNSTQHTSATKHYGKIKKPVAPDSWRTVLCIADGDVFNNGSARSFATQVAISIEDRVALVHCFIRTA